MNNYTVYWIHLKSHFDEKLEGYIGISKSYNKRGGRRWTHFNNLKHGTHKNPILQNAYNYYGIKQFEISIILEGSFNICISKEIELRPKEYIGWNVFPGGGYPPNHKGTHWFTNGKENKLSITCPYGFYAGKVQISGDNHKGKNKPKSKEHKKQLSIAITKYRAKIKL